MTTTNTIQNDDDKASEQDDWTDEDCRNVEITPKGQQYLLDRNADRLREMLNSDRAPEA
jgi:hypothetical protein